MTTAPTSIAEHLRAGQLGLGVKKYRAGTERTVSPEETLNAVLPLLPAMGITRVANVTGLDSVGIPVVMVSRPNSRSISVAQGKGATLAAAKASGVMEAIESYHAEHITLPLKLASYEELRYTHNVVDVAKLPRLATTRYSQHAPLLWIEGRSLVSGDNVWVPYETVHLNYTTPLPPGHGCFLASSNGLASGNTLEEAVSHGISEIVERDAATLWHLRDAAAQAATKVDLDTIDDGWVNEMIQRFLNAGVDVGIWEITSDIGLPAFLCRAVQRDGARYGMRPAVGMGCHPSKVIAVLRSLTEAAQSRLTFISGARDDMPRSEYEHFLDPAVQARWSAQVTGVKGTRDFRAVPSVATDAIGRDIETEVARILAAGGTDVVMVDLTKPEFGVPVARVVIPGLEGMDHAGYLPGARARYQAGAAARANQRLAS